MERIPRTKERKTKWGKGRERKGSRATKEVESANKFEKIGKDRKRGWQRTEMEASARGRSENEEGRGGKEKVVCEGEKVGR